MAVNRAELRELFRSDPDAAIALFERQEAKISEQEARIAGLEAEIAELKALLGQNSRNSSRPPSSDVFLRPKSQRVKGEKPPGGQKGHVGRTLRMVETPDNVVVHHVTACKKCRVSLENEPVVDVERRQVFDMPPLRIVVSEHQAEEKQCPCCHTVTKAEFPMGVEHHVQYGDNILAFIVYLLVFQLLPYDRIKDMFSDVFQHSVGGGTLMRAVKSCYDHLAVFEDFTRYGLLKSEVLHVDETGVRVKGKREWLHEASTGLLTFYKHHRKRGAEAMDEMRILPDYKGVSLHDFWKPYLRYPCIHAFCNAHVLRELRGVTENTGQHWSESMSSLLRQIKTTVDKARPISRSLSEEQLIRFEIEYLDALMQGIRENQDEYQKSGGRKQSKAKNLMDRLQEYQQGVLLFMRDFRVPFDNNQAERDLRMMKVHEKISGTFRSTEGADWFCRIRGYISILIKNNQPVLPGIRKIFQGHPYIPHAALKIPLS